MELSARHASRASAAVLWVGALLLSGLFLYSCGGGYQSSSPPPPPPPPPPNAISEQVIVVGQTDSANFPTTGGAAQSNYGGGVTDGVVSSLQLTTTSSTTSQFRFSTYLGGNGLEQIRDVFIDQQGNIYVVGETSSTNLPTTPGVFQRNYAGGPDDGFIGKYSPTGQLVWLSYMGGSGDKTVEDQLYNLYVDGAGDIYASGHAVGCTGTCSTPWPAPCPANANGTGDAVFTKIKGDGTQVLWCRFIGGSGDEQARGRMGVVESGAHAGLYQIGPTSSTDFPTTANAPFKTSTGGQTPWMLKLTLDGQTLAYSTYIGSGGNGGGAGGLAVNSAGETYGCSFTNTSIPIVGPGFQQTKKGTTQAYVVKLAADGSALLASTYLGGSGSSFQSCEALALDSSGNVVVLGPTGAPDFPTTAGVFQTVGQGGNDIWVAKLRPDLSSLVFSTYVGTALDESLDGGRVEPDASDNLWFHLNTSSSAFPTTADALQKTYGGGSREIVVVKLASDGSRIVYATYLGGSGSDISRSLRYKKN